MVRSGGLLPRNGGGTPGPATPRHVRPQQGGVPGHRCSPVVPDDERPLLTRRVDEPDDVARQVQDAVRGDVLGTAAAAVAALVGRG